MRALIFGLFCGLFLICVGNSIAALPSSPQKLTQEGYEEDFDYLWKEISENYAYWDKKTTDWAKVKAIHRPRLVNVKKRDDFIALLENTLEELYDFHAGLNTNTPSSPRLVPTGADIWAEWRKDRAIITEVRPGSNADRAGLEAGMDVLSINGVGVEKAVADRIGKSLRTGDPAARNWALRVLLAGRHNEERRVEVGSGDARKTQAINDRPPPEREGSKAHPLLEQKRLNQGPGIGYIRINNSLGSIELIKEFDEALAKLNAPQGLILDLRDTPSGGNSTVARGIMGRFIDREEPYQKHVDPGEERQTGIKRSWIEIVSPRGPHYPGPVVVLVDHWTGSMGEGIAIGLDAMKRAKIVGTEMAGLIGATSTITLPRTGIGVSFPVEKLYHPNGTPREDFLPSVYVDLQSQDNRKTNDPVLEAGLKTLNSLVK